MHRNMQNWIQSIIHFPKRQALPIMTYPGLELAGRTIRQIVTDGRAQFECVQAVAKAFPTAASVTTMDLSVEAQAFGSPVQFSEVEVPAVSGRIVHDTASIEALKIPEIGAGRTPQFLLAAELAARHIFDRPVFGGMIGPFSLAGRLYDMTEIMVDLLLEPEAIHALMDKCTRFLVHYAGAIKQTGVNGLLIAEPAAGLLSPAQTDAFSSQYIRRIVEQIQDETFTIILHNCGNTAQLVPSMVSTQAAGLHFGNAVDMAQILPGIPGDKLVCGNIDPAGLFRRGTPQDVFNATAALLEKTAGYPNFVLSSGCDIPPGTPLANVEAFFQALKEFNGGRAFQPAAHSTI